MIGPPESPRHVSVAPPPAHTIDVALNSEAQPVGAGPAHVASLSIGLLASSSWELLWKPVSVTLQPMTVAWTPVPHRDASLLPMSRSGASGTAAARCSSARS